MSRSGQGGGGPPLASSAAGSSRPPAQLGDSGFDAQAAPGLVGLDVVGHVLRSCRCYERVIVGAIVLRALRGLGQVSRASTMARLQAWNNRQVQLLERQARRQARRLAVWAKLRILRPRAGQPTAC